MSDRRVVKGLPNWLMWLVGGASLVIGFGAVAIFGGVWQWEELQEESPVVVEEFRVAEPLTDNGSVTIRDQLEVITAVTEPYDEVEQAAEDEEQQPASSSAELILQCTTVLKEMAFCSGDDAFLDIIGEADTLRTGEERELFMQRVQDWFEPGGARRYCEGLFDQDGAEAHERLETWSKSAQASGQVCEKFGEALMETEIFELLAVYW